MTQVAKPSYEPVGPTPRLSMSPARRERILALYDYHCSAPGCFETQGLILDHVIPLELNGADEDFNIEPRCPFHDKPKTKADQARIAKARRLHKKADPATRKPSRMKSRPMQTKLTRGFDGKVRARKARP